MSLDQLWNGWRSQYVRGFNEGTRNEPGRSVFTAILQSGSSDEETHIVHRGPTCFAILNAFPYAVGHVLLLPYREVSELEDLSVSETAELWSVVTCAVRAVKSAYRPEGLNVGINLGEAAGRVGPDDPAGRPGAGAPAAARWWRQRRGRRSVGRLGGEPQ